MPDPFEFFPTANLEAELARRRAAAGKPLTPAEGRKLSPAEASKLFSDRIREQAGRAPRDGGEQR